jgi:uncharacterized protein YaiI (UPF0178 family)
MTIWIDADACPVAIKEILYRAAERTRTPLILVANQSLRTPGSTIISSVRVSQGFDEADDYLVHHAQPGDLVISSDIPLASRLLANKVEVITPRGEPMTEANIGERLAIRDFLDTMRGSGIQSGGPAPLNAADKQQFANALDRWLAKQPR